MMKNAQQELYLSDRRDGLRGRRLRQVEPEKSGLQSHRLRQELYALLVPYLHWVKKQ